MNTQEDKDESLSIDLASLDPALAKLLRYVGVENPVSISVVRLFLVIFVFWLVVGYAIPMAVFSDPGAFGDMFGAVNALFSGLAFAGVIYAMFLQKRELGYQREELQNTRLELAGQKEQLKAQNDTLRKQRFENTFFSLVGFQNEIVMALRIDRHAESYVGRDCMRFFYNEFKSAYGHESHERRYASESELVKKAYARFFLPWQPYIGHYFRSLYNIVKFVKHSDIEDKQMYVNLLRSQLSVYELSLLFYNCLSEYGNERFKNLVEEFALLENLSDGLLLMEDHRQLYELGAFEEKIEEVASFSDESAP